MQILNANNERRKMKVPCHQETSVPRLYATGDVVRGLNQVVVAAAAIAIAATDIHDRLRAHENVVEGGAAVRAGGM